MNEISEDDMILISTAAMIHASTFGQRETIRALQRMASAMKAGDGNARIVSSRGVPHNPEVSQAMDDMHTLWMNVVEGKGRE